MGVGIDIREEAVGGPNSVLSFDLQIIHDEDGFPEQMVLCPRGTRDTSVPLQIFLGYLKFGSEVLGEGCRLRPSRRSERGHILVTEKWRPPVSAVLSPHDWLEGYDTGTSSLVIYHVMMGVSWELIGKGGRPDVPHDPDDFGRCYRLLKLFPEWSDRMHLVAEAYPEWEPFVSNWAELVALHEEESPSGSAPKLYARMKEITEETT